MKVFQASWDINGYLVLSEIQNATIQEKETALTTFDSLDNSLFHPFTCSQKQIELDLELLEFPADFYKISELFVPSDKYGPFVSPLFISSRNIENATDLEMRKWSINTACFNPFSTACFLTNFPSNLSDMPTNFKFDKSVLFWLEVTKFILELIASGKFLPGIVDKYKSHWHIIINDSYDKERLAILKKDIPPICKGYVQTATNNMVVQDMVESFITVVGDALIKNFLRRHSFLPHISTNAASPSTMVALEWLKNLTNPSQDKAYQPALELELQILNNQLKNWSQRLLSDSQKTELITGFELIAPNTSTVLPTTEQFTPINKTWTLNFFLTTSNNKNKLIFPEQIWSGTSEVLKSLDYSYEEIEDFFLNSLGTACGIFTPLKRSLMEAFPANATITSAEAYLFLRQAATILENTGFHIILPTWWTNPKHKLGLKLDIEALQNQLITKGHKSFFSANQLINCSWKIMAGETEIDFEAFKEIVDNEDELININGTWIEVDKEKIKSTKEFLEENGAAKQLTISEALRLGNGLISDEALLPIMDFTAQGWLNALLDSSNGDYEKLEQPKEFIGELRPYQKDGMSWLHFLSSIGMGSCLADDMGLGKTIQFLAFLLKEKEEGKLTDPTLLIVPMSTLNNWINEFATFAPALKPYLHHGSTRLSGDDFIKCIKDTDVILTTYALAFRDEEFISKVNWGRIALDEAQSIKNLGTKQTQSIRKLVDKQMHTSTRSSSCQRIALTGTPMENHLEELWSIMDFLNPGYLGTISSFRTRFAVPIERYQNQEVAKNLNKIISPFILRRVKTDPKIIDDLPEKLEMIEYIDLTKEQAKLYENTLSSLFPQIDEATGIHRKGLVLSTITKLKQICNHPELSSVLPEKISANSGKLNRLEELLGSFLQTEDKVLIFTQFAQMGHLLKKYLEERLGLEILFLHGGLSKAARDKLVTRFQNPTEEINHKIFILSLKAGGLGLNLTEANQVVHFDQWWNPAVEDQATDRAFRIGQKRNVQVRKFICRGTLEERIAEMSKNKKNLADSIIGSTKNFITELSTDELHDLLRLTQAPVDFDDEL